MGDEIFDPKVEEEAEPVRPDTSGSSELPQSSPEGPAAGSSTGPRGGQAAGGGGHADDVAEREEAGSSVPQAAGVDAAAADSDALQQQNAELLDTLRRVQADFENFRKRVMRDQAAHADRAAEGLVEQLLPVLDSFELAVL
ncbi:MAG TPA: nucleotide exchange factor GrpE, partial [Acidimicrobiia bacterium]|nr:nucleotide exchange factor GrpE [Acidimicrobiia bacterium]